MGTLLHTPEARGGRICRSAASCFPVASARGACHPAGVENARGQSPMLYQSRIRTRRHASPAAWAEEGMPSVAAAPQMTPQGLHLQSLAGPCTSRALCYSRHPGSQCRLGEGRGGRERERQEREGKERKGREEGGERKEREGQASSGERNKGRGEGGELYIKTPDRPPHGGCYW